MAIEIGRLEFCALNSEFDQSNLQALYEFGGDHALNGSIQQLLVRLRKPMLLRSDTQTARIRLGLKELDAQRSEGLTREILLIVERDREDVPLFAKVIDGRLGGRHLLAEVFVLLPEPNRRVLRHIQPTFHPLIDVNLSDRIRNLGCCLGG